MTFYHVGRGTRCGHALTNVMAHTLFHPLPSVTALPVVFNNPFYYEPHPVCQLAMGQLAAWLRGEDSPFSAVPAVAAFREEAGRGKMFGVLVVRREADGAAGYLAGYSGQLCGRSDWTDFVPAVFDYLQPDGHFKRHEAEIVGVNREIDLLEAERRVADDEAERLDEGDPRPMFEKAKGEGETDEEHVRRRQFENAELHRWKVRHKARMAQWQARWQEKEVRLLSLKRLRRQKSDDLQRWLFSHFSMMNARGERKDLLEIFGAIPPSGSGECCEPKLLQYAYTHGLHPLGMAMMWWGDSPKREVRHHGHYYPACNKRCKPILGWMLRGLDVAPNPLEQPTRHSLETLYEDADICVVLKPAGMLSVPGKSGRESVEQVMRLRYPEVTCPLIVHRLDMATSGLMVITKTPEAYKDLQAQFARHEVKKRYVALLSRDLDTPSGEISLPLRPDLDDRPRQVVDEEHGREAVSAYEQAGRRRVILYPHTGRTHQLRVHCAHRKGLDNPIQGDELYGTKADRLYLHAEQITFRHPTTGRMMVFTAKAPF